MMPQCARTKSVDIYYWHNTYIFGFKFFDSDSRLIFKIGITTHPKFKVETVLLGDNEVIVGVVARFWGLPVYQSIYTDFQF